MCRMEEHWTTMKNKLLSYDINYNQPDGTDSLFELQCICDTQQGFVTSNKIKILPGRSHKEPPLYKLNRQVECLSSKNRYCELIVLRKV